MSDNEFSDGNDSDYLKTYLYVAIVTQNTILGQLKLIKKKIIILTETEKCSSCSHNSCIHYQAFEQCSEFQCLVWSSPNIMVTYRISLLTSKRFL